MAQIHDHVRRFRDDFAELLSGPSGEHTGPAALMQVRQLAETLHGTLVGDDMRAFVLALASDAMIAANLPPAERLALRRWLLTRLAHECALLDLLHGEAASDVA